MIYMSSFTKKSDRTSGTYTKRVKRKDFVQRQIFSDTIYTFDIETTSLFKFASGYNVFDYSKSPDFYSNIDKIAIPYIWMFGVEDDVYYGREFSDFEKILNVISDENITKTIWIHNLSFEFGFLPNILNKYTIENMTARDIRKPISFHVKELNITFRCSYMLTNLSLAKASEEYTDLKKLDTLAYDSKVRTPKTKLSNEELEYCKYDILCLHGIIKHYLKQYGHIAKIPLTATGEVRNALREHVDYYYIREQWELVPTAQMYLRLMACFQGGYTHANVLNVNRVFFDVHSYDISSSYPTVMCLEKFPCDSFKYIDYDDYVIKKQHQDSYAFMFHVKLHKVNSRYYNNYISYSRCKYVDSDSLIYDNGRVKKCDLIEMWLTDVDLDIIEKNYRIEDIEYLDIYYAPKDYLDIRVIKFILEMYGNKTKLKGIDSEIDIYKKSKAYINSLYGMSVTNPLKNSTEYIDNEWVKKELTMDFVNEVLEETKKSFSTLFYYAVGVWVTAYARRNLYTTILYSHEFDRHVIYCDTDSIKYYGEYDHIFEEYNKNVYKKYEIVCKKLSQLNISDFEPVDKNGVKHPLGIFDYEGKYKKFKTLGAKKYCYVDDDDKLHITVSGVSKKGASALKSIDDFKDGFTWGYHESGKLTHFYNDEQSKVKIIDADGNIYINKYKYGIILQPTTYTLGIDELYQSLFEDIQDREERKK